MSWKSDAYSSRFIATGSSSSRRPTPSAASRIQRACEEVYSSLASSALASDSIVEMKVRSRLS
jgi:hypothetical protein